MVSDVKGTTTDPVRKPMEVPGLGAVVFIDTAGFDDSGTLGEKRVALTRKALDEADMALLLTGENPEEEAIWRERVKEKGIALLEVAAKADLGREAREGATRVSAATGEGRDALIEAMARAMPADFDAPDLLRNLAGKGDNVVLVMPQDSQAPKGRLILPQVQTIRALLDKGCNALCTTPEGLEPLLASLREPPRLVITDSQVFATVAEKLSGDVPLTSFSVLMAAFKGDIGFFAEGAAAIDTLKPGDRVLIAEACTHAPKSEDIGRVKIPALLRRRAGGELRIDVAGGKDFPADLSVYRLVVHCGACMFNRRLVMTRVEQARRQGVAMTNYGIAIAHLSGILPRITY